MADMVQAKKKIALLHRYPASQIKETNAAFPFIQKSGVDVLTFKTFDKLNSRKKFFKSLAWIFYAPILVWQKKYDVIYCDDSYPFYPALVKMVSPKSRVIIRIGDLHLMYHYSGFVFKMLHALEVACWKKADDIVVISEAMAEYVQGELLDNEYSIYTVLDPVDPDDFPIEGSYAGGVVMFHGLLTKNKNVDVLLEAAKLLPDVEFEIVGDGPDRKRLEKLAPKNVFFLGWVPFKMMRHQIRRCSVGVALRSDNPGNDYVITSPFLQYGVMGKPCLTTRRKVFGSYEWQFSTAGEMAQKIKILMRHPECGAELRKYILENHDAKKIAEQICRLMQA